MSTDLRFAFRRLRQAPVFTAFAVITLALAIGITTAVYSLVRSGLQPDLGLDDASRLVVVAALGYTRVPSATPMSWLDYQDLIAQQTTLERVAVWAPFMNALVIDGSAEFASGELVSGDYFATVDLRPLRGRLIDPSDDRPDAVPVAVLSETAWRLRLRRDPAVVGAIVKIGGHPFQVVGIAPESFHGVDRPRGLSRPEIWIPLSSARLIASRTGRQDPNRRDHRPLLVVGRLKPGIDKPGASADIERIGRRLDAAVPLPDQSFAGGGRVPQTRNWKVVGADEPLDLGDARDVFRVILLLPALVLLVACTNLANFALSRGVARENEFGMRRALGASRWQVIRGQLVESALLALAGGVGALLVADQLLALVATTVRELFGNLPQYRVFARVDGPVLAAVGAAAVMSLVVAGLIPAFQLTRRSLSQTIGSDQSSALPRWRGRSNLIALQVSVSVALLLVSALCVRQLPKLASAVDSGMSLDRVALVSVPFEGQGLDEARIRRTLDRMFENLRDVRGIAAMAASSDRKFLERVNLVPEGRPIVTRDPNRPIARVVSVSPEYFTTVGLPLVAGRAFTDADARASEPVAIISASQARTLFGRMDAVGERLAVESDWTATERATLTIVGVSGDTRATRGTVETFLYRPLRQRFERFVPITIQARAADGVDAGALAKLMRDALRRVDPDIAVGFVGVASAVDVGPEVVLQLFVVGFGTLAFLALGFAMSGLYGVLSHVVARRTRELGVRAALGAEPGHLIRLVLKDGTRPVLEGIVIGFGMAAGARLGMQPWFTDPVTAVDPVALVIALVPLVIAAALACYLPARRAARVDPNVSLRHL